MRSFSEYDPITIAVYFLTVTGIAMFCHHPAVTVIALSGGLLLYLERNRISGGRFHLFLLGLFVVLAAVNPLISHNGATVLLVVNDSPVTLEALLYGVNSAAMIVAVLYWLRSFTQIMTSEKLLRIFGVLSPKLALALSMTVRFVPMFSRQARRINDTQKALGLYREDNVIDGVCGSMRVFDILVTWALENGIITADSMEARGYGSGRRTPYTDYRLHRWDILLLTADFILAAVCIAAAAADSLDISFYPHITVTGSSALRTAGAAAYGVLVLLPVIIDTEVSIRWRLFRSAD
ncbi:MAG TPA: cobalt transport protein [Ruminococcus sp.]|nr:cobalt transport protein [Ruminococcus sp.]